MASIHHKTGSAFWHCAFYLPDGRRTLRSTGTSDKRKAWQICQQFEKAARLGREARFTEARARETIADIYQVANQEALPSSSVKDYLYGWLAAKKLEVAESSYSEYGNCVGELLTFLGPKAEQPMDAITLRDLGGFRAALAKRVAGATCNKVLKILRGAWGRAVKEGILRENCLARVELVKAQRTARRAFTLPELKRILAECDSEWRGLVLLGIYTGQRLGDLAGLTWNNLDLQADELRLTTRKTHRALAIPLARPLKDYILNLPAPDSPGAPLFPNVFTLADKRVGTLSNQFTEILARAGLASKRPHVDTGKGRNVKRKVGGLSFHCLRHTATSLLKNAGVSDAVAREIVGHDSEDISRVYTHIEASAMREALDKLPDVLGDAEAAKPQ